MTQAFDAAFIAQKSKVQILSQDALMPVAGEGLGPVLEEVGLDACREGTLLAASKRDGGASAVCSDFSARIAVGYPG